MKLKEWLTVLVLASTGTFLAMVFVVVAPMLPLVAEHFGGGVDGAFVAQWILTMPSIGVIVGGPTTGWFVERFGARVVLFTCLAIFAASGAAGFVIEDRTLLLATRFLVGLSATGQVTAAMAIIGETFSEERRGPVLGLQNAIATALSVVMTFSSGTVAQHYGWRAPFTLYASALVALLLGILVIPAVSQARAATSKASASLFTPLIPLYALVTISMIISFLSSNQVPLLLSADGFNSPLTISNVLGVGTIFFAAGAIGYGKIRARLGVSWTFALALAFQCAGVVKMSVGHGILGIGLGTVLLSFGGGIQTPNLSHWVMDRAPLAIRGRAMGLLFSAQFLGPFLNSAVVSPAFMHFGLRNVLMFIGILIGLGVLVTGLRARSLPQTAQSR